MELIPILEHAEDNADFIHNPLCRENIYTCIDFYKRVGYSPPWICYYAIENGELIGCAGYKGKPIGGSIEISRRRSCLGMGISP